MSFIKKEIFKKIIRNDDLTHLNERLEKSLNQLEENVFYSQGMIKTGSWTHDLVKNETFWSDEIYNILECSPEDFDDRLESFYCYIHPDDREEVIKEVQYVLEGKEYDIEYRITTPKGIEKFLRGKTKILYDENMNLIKIIGIIQDITEQKIIENNLKEFGKDLSYAQTIAGVGSWKYDVGVDKIFCSDETYRIYGITPKEYNITYERFLEIVHPEDVEIIEAIFRYPPKKPISIEFRVIRYDASIRHIYQRMEFIFDKEEKPVYVYGTIQDITEKKALRKAIESKQKEINKIQHRFQTLIQESNDGFEIIDSNGVIKYTSESVEKITGYKPEERIGKIIYEFFVGEELEKVVKMVEFVLNDSSKKVQGDIIFRTKHGDDIYLDVYMQNLLHEPSVEGIVVNFRDITRRVEMEKRMTHISTHDGLTDLPNSVYFKKQLKSQCEYVKEAKTKFALMMLDIDGLKYINYSLGYEFGDQLVIEIVKRLRGFLGEDKFLCRYSDDHFAIIIEGINTKDEYGYIADGLIKLFSKPYKLNNYELDVGVNIGICICPNDAQDMDFLKKGAKVALLRAKKDGKNKYKFYSSELDIQNYKECILRSDLHNAIENNQLRVYYQPIINIKTSEILGAEALIRWEHPDWGMISPDEFIPLAEETGLIIDIGKWILREVCKNYKQWLKNNLPAIKVSVNFSGIQFLENNFVKNIKRIIDEFELEPKFLIMEITESVLLKNANKVLTDIQNLKSFGIQVALDDFGTGFSSLSYLTYFNIDILKLDGSFVRNIPLDETSAAITRSTINLAKELKIKLVAEGIEKWDQLSYLKHLNCHLGQGFIYSKPIPLEDFEKILSKRKCKPTIVNYASIRPSEERRRFFRIKFAQLLEADLTILEIKGKKINVGNTKVLIKNIGPGGLCFISNIRFPIEKGIILQFTTELIEKEIKVYGCPVWTEEIDNKLYEYGVEFTIDENERGDLIGDLNQVQIKIRKNILFAEGSFISGSYNQYFKLNRSSN